MKKSMSGFTIVELLIVIVVIAILAAISIVAFTGIQSRANDSAVQNDLRNFATKIMEYHALNGNYPAGGRPRNVTTSSCLPIPNIESYPFARNAYAVNANNVYYCEGNGTFAIGATSKSGTRYRYIGGSGLAVHTGNWGNADVTCTTLLGLSSSSRDFTVSFAFRPGDGWNSMS